MERDGVVSLPPEPVATADWGYARRRRAGYGAEELAGWAARLRGLPCREALVFFKHDEGTASVDSARTLRAPWGTAASS